MNATDLSWAFITGYYYPKFLVVAKGMEWDERYEFLRTLYDDKNTDTKWEERSENPISDMMNMLHEKTIYTSFAWALPLMMKDIIKSIN
jgi:hypothetical protein